MKLVVRQGWELQVQGSSASYTGVKCTLINIL